MESIKPGAPKTATSHMRAVVCNVEENHEIQLTDILNKINMKKLILIIAVLSITNFIQGQDLPINEKTGKITYSEIKKIDSLSKSELYVKVLEWFAYKFNSSKDVIQLKDDVKMKIIGKGGFGIKYYTRDPNIYFTISVFLKDNRYKIVITDLKYSDNQGEEFLVDNFPKSWAGKKKLYRAVDAEVKLILTDFYNYMKATNEEEDW